MLDHKIKRKWCAALRGGYWEQIYGAYDAGGNKRCAIGVLAEVVMMSPNALPWIMGTGFSAYVVRLNDATLLPFAQIADWIEINPGKAPIALLCERNP